MQNNYIETGLEIAVIGMSGRFPGAENVEEFWNNLINGVESVTKFSNEELLEEGISAELVDNPNYVKSKPMLNNIYSFDAALFGYTNWEAENMDPQIRIFHECVYHALENAGYNPDTYKGRIGLYAGASVDVEWLKKSMLAHESRDMDILQTGIVSYKDFLSQLVSYKLNLTGPSYTIYTACSTSLAAIHLACQGLLLGDCNIAVAGGVTVIHPNKSGYLYEEGRIYSKDGHCKPFDNNADGTVFGDGAGAVVLKRLDDALEDGDTILAVIKASACNNDGRRKVGFIAPSIEGQKEVIETVFEMSSIPPHSISYVETHGTGTNVGDPIEIEALKQAFGIEGIDTPRCTIGSVKANIGHLHAAAGVASFIKVVLSMNKGKIPPQINYTQPNQKIKFFEKCFNVNTTPVEWKKENAILRAGISSFGVGGTNVHLILEEAPKHAEKEKDAKHSFDRFLLIMSAKSAFSLEQMTNNMANFLEKENEINMADAAFTLQMGRRQYNYRKICIASDAQDGAQALKSNDAQKVFSTYQEYSCRPVAFMFTGQGSQYAGMIGDLYERSCFVREQVDMMAEIVSCKLGFDIRNYLLNKSDSPDFIKEQIHQTSIAQPALFITEYTLAKYLMQFGIIPKIMVGHSLGEYVAATLAGVFDLEDALNTVVERGRLMQSTRHGSMLAVGLTQAEAEEYLSQDISLAAVNNPGLCVLSGAEDAIFNVQKRLDGLNVFNKQLVTSHAFHSHFMDEILDSFYNHMSGIKLNKPSIPFFSCLTGRIADDKEVTDPNYWVKQLRNTVKFCQCAQSFTENTEYVFIEIGPGNTLINHAKSCSKYNIVALQSLPGAKENKSHSQILLECLGKMWLLGVDIKWEELYENERRRRIPLPLYPFERKTYICKTESDRKHNSQLYVDKEWKALIYTSAWKQTILPASEVANDAGVHEWLIFTDSSREMNNCVAALIDRGHKVMIVKAGDSYKKLDQDIWTVNPENNDDMMQLAEDLKNTGISIDRCVYGWLMEPSRSFSQENDKIYNTVCNTFIRAVDVLAMSGIMKDASEIYVVVSELFDVTAAKCFNPLKRAIIGPCTTIPQEYPGMSCRVIDIPVEMLNRSSKILLTEILSGSIDTIVAYRGGKRFIRSYEVISEDFIKRGGYDFEGGVFVIFNSAKEAGYQESFLKSQGNVKIEYRTGYNYDEIRFALEDVHKKNGKINGVFYCLNISDELIKGVKQLTVDDLDCLSAKGLLHLKEAVQGLGVEFCWVESSLSAIVGGVGFTAISAVANQLDALVESFCTDNWTENTKWICVNWDFMKSSGKAHEKTSTWVVNRGISEEERNHIYERIFTLLGRVGNLYISSGRLASEVKRESMNKNERTVINESSYQKRPKMANEYIEPRNEAERIVCEIIEELLSVKPVGIQDNFIDLGGHSLLLTRVASRVKDVFRIDIPLKVVMDTPTVEGIMNYISTQWEESDIELIAMAYREYKKIIDERE